MRVRVATNQGGFFVAISNTVHPMLLKAQDKVREQNRLKQLERKIQGNRHH